MPKLFPSKNAFSLVELSVVLVVIGLITGGVMAGRSLIKASSLRELTSDIQRYSTAMSQFQQEYNALPGDFSSAVTYWTSAAGTGADATCYSATKTSEATCNGDGDGLIETTNPANALVTDGTEMFLFWQHLYAAEIIKGQYSGTTATAASIVVKPGTNTPLTRLTNVTFSAYSPNTCYSGDGTWYDGCYQHVLTIGTNSGSALLSGALLAEEVFNIDKKIDDSMPASGNFRALKGDASCGSATAYSLTYGSASCRAAYGLTRIQ